MPRRRPAEVRDDGPFRYDWPRPVPVLPHVSARGQALVRRLENTRYVPGAAAQAWGRWSAIMRHDARRWCHDPDCEFCESWFGRGDVAGYREVLDAVVRVLPPRDARALRRRIAELDR